MSTGKHLGTAIKLLGALRAEIDPYIPSQMAECLLAVALQPGLRMEDLSKRTGLAQSSCSRNIAALSKWHRLGKEGFDLVEAVDDPRERRRKIVYLTPKGVRVVNKVMAAVDPSFELDVPSAKEGLSLIYTKTGS